MPSSNDAQRGGPWPFSPEFETLGLNSFCHRQFDDPNYPGTRIPMDKVEFMNLLRRTLIETKPHIHAGYADFCKHIFIENFTEAKISTLPITESNRHLLRSGYHARRPEELAVLGRWFPYESVVGEIRKAKYLDLILYSRKQIAKEDAAMAKKEEVVEDTSEPLWSIISIKAQDEPYELPMNPITSSVLRRIMRNALIEEGGSGVAIDREAYSRSVTYWSQHAVVQSENS